MQHQCTSRACAQGPPGGQRPTPELPVQHAGLVAAAVALTEGAFPAAGPRGGPSSASLAAELGA
eukprot:8640477-Lingulodinium_polyedra.AAC.1